MVLVLNEGHRIATCLERLQWADRIVVVDAFSTDDTVLIAEKFGAEVIQKQWVNFADQRNFALQNIEADWVVFVDADEIVPDDLAREICNAISGRPRFAAYWIPRKNNIFGHEMLGAGWYPDYQLRVIKRGCAKFDLARPVHEVAIVDGDCGRLIAHLVHEGPTSISEFRTHQNKYVELQAEGLDMRGVRARKHSPISQAIKEWFRRMITWKGYRDGQYGLLTACLMAEHEFKVYKKLAELQVNTD